MGTHRVLVTLFVAVATLSVVEAQDVLVTVQEGTLRGETVTGRYGVDFVRFLGIPYAEPPVGELRFQAPVPASGWDGVRDATQEASNCTQEDDGSEDCLYLNVNVPANPATSDPLPVLVWVHGGGFTSGTSSYHRYGPDFLVAYDVIFVSMNYRLGPLGFLSLQDEGAPGNAGLKDQRLALQWVQDNIASFGGDPQSVTLGGQSAGGASVSFHLTSPQSAGLFSRVIIGSGTFVASMSTVRDPQEMAFRLGAALGFETDDPQQLLDFLRSVDAADLIVADDLIETDEEKLYITYIPWAPTIEPDLDGAFISESPITMLTEGRFNQVPILIGTTSDETGFDAVVDSEFITNLNEQFENVVGPCIHLPSAELQTAAALIVRDFYFGNDTISAADADSLVNIDNDMSYFEGTDALVRTVADTTDLPVYYYEFDYRGTNVDYTPWGVKHAGEMGFLFVRDELVQDLDPDSEEDHVRRNMLALWTNFVKYGDPSPEADPVSWTQYDSASRSYLLMQANFSIASGKAGDRMDFWSNNIPLLSYPATV